MFFSPQPFTFYYTGQELLVVWCVCKARSTRIEHQSFSHALHARYLWRINFIEKYDKSVSLKRRAYDWSIFWLLMAHYARRSHKTFRYLRHVGQSKIKIFGTGASRLTRRLAVLCHFFFVFVWFSEVNLKLQKG